MFNRLLMRRHAGSPCRGRSSSCKSKRARISWHRTTIRGLSEATTVRALYCERPLGAKSPGLNACKSSDRDLRVPCQFVQYQLLVRIIQVRRLGLGRVTTATCLRNDGKGCSVRVGCAWEAFKVSEGRRSSRCQAISLDEEIVFV